jgi:biotin transport system substrate-specific component
MTTQTLSLPMPLPWVKDCLLVVLGSILISLSAGIAIPLPFTPVPLALAPHVCLALGATLGSRRGALAVFLHLIQGLCGLPVFAMGSSGLLTLLGPSGGYLIGYVAGAYVTGFLIETMRQRSRFQTFTALAVGNGIIYGFGVMQLALFVGCQSAILLGVIPFLIGDAWKLLAIHYFVRRNGHDCSV